MHREYDGKFALHILLPSNFNQTHTDRLIVHSSFSSSIINPSIQSHITYMTACRASSKTYPPRHAQPHIKQTHGRQVERGMLCGERLRYHLPTIYMVNKLHFTSQCGVAFKCRLFKLFSLCVCFCCMCVLFSQRHFDNVICIMIKDICVYNCAKQQKDANMIVCSDWMKT